MVTWLDDQSFPSRFDNSNELDDFLSRSSRALATDQGVCADTDTQRRTAAAADILAGKRAVVQAGCRCEDAPRHHAASFYTEVESQPINVTDIVFRRAIIGPETASQFLVRADNEPKAGRGSAAKNAHFCATRLLGCQWKAGAENEDECRDNLANLKHCNTFEVCYSV